jgi:acyl-CoA reductase-like NAD-dependent aldehyde dehydrogenase
MYGGFEKGSPDMGKIVTDWHCDRLKSLIDSSKGKILTGGKVYKDIKYVEPTIIMNPDRKAPVMEEEIFGPILPIMTFLKIDEVIDFINTKDKALALYYFGKCYNNPNKDRIINETSSGAFVVNEVLVQMVNHEFGFGGVGPSGYGRYGGYDGFKQWSNPKSIMIKPTMNFYPYSEFNPPFPEAKQRLIRKLLATSGT